VYHQYKPTIEGGIIPSLKKLAPALSSLASDLIGAGTLVEYLKNGLPAAISKNAPLGIRTFYALWQEVMQGVKLLSPPFRSSFIPPVSSLPPSPVIYTLRLRDFLLPRVFLFCI
jgi:hypothetical protein